MSRKLLPGEFHAMNNKQSWVDFPLTKQAMSALRRRITFAVRNAVRGSSEHVMMLNGKRVGKMTVGGKGGDTVFHSEISPRMQGLGLGKKLYGHVLGQSPTGALRSDPRSLSEGAGRVYQSMAKRPASYAVTRHADARLSDGLPGYREWSAGGMGNSPFTATRRWQRRT